MDYDDVAKENYLNCIDKLMNIAICIVSRWMLLKTN